MPLMHTVELNAATGASLWTSPTGATPDAPVLTLAPDTSPATGSADARSRDNQRGRDRDGR